MAQQGIATIGAKVSYATKSGESWSTFTEIKGLQALPAMTASVSKIDVTTLADGTRKYIPGLKDFGDLAFNFLYDKDVFDEVRALEDSLIKLKVELPSASTFSFEAYITVGLDAVAIDDALKFTITAYLNSDITVA